MNQHDDIDTLPADTPTTTQIATTPTRGDRDGHDVTTTSREGVNAMARKPERSRARRKRAWDEMSDTDRQVLLEAVRQRREMQALQDAHRLQMLTQR
ncbi:MAG: hypothetical protein NTV28_00730 [Propionibacteriales bacterium]|nr:hypothetical protein [Propionibacteriales bacterium]